MDKEASNLVFLPQEILELIFMNETLTHSDLCRLSLVCKHLHAVCNRDIIWKQKYNHRWPMLGEKIASARADSWREEYRIRYDCAKAILDKLGTVAEDCYRHEVLSTEMFADFASLCDPHPLQDHVVLDVLTDIFNGTDACATLTHQYYAKMGLRCMRQKLMGYTWEEYSQNPQKLTLYKGVKFISEYCQPTKVGHLLALDEDVNAICAAVFNLLAKKKPHHPAVLRGMQDVLMDRDEVLGQSLWSPEHCVAIFTAMNEVLYDQKKFSPGPLPEMPDPIQCMFLEEAIHQVIILLPTFLVLYETIASRFGAHCTVVEYKGYFFLRFLTSPLHFSADEHKKYTYIDLIQKGKASGCEGLSYVLSDDFTFSIPPQELKPVSYNEVFSSIGWQLADAGRSRDDSGGEQGAEFLCDALELMALLTPDDHEHQLLLARVYLHFRINLRRVLQLLEDVGERDPANAGMIASMFTTALSTLETETLRQPILQPKAKVRSDAGVTFSVGMVMKHKRYDYRCVIYGWDARCTATQSWQRQMGVQDLPLRDAQPFYNVLVDDGTSRYAAQENLEIDTTMQPIPHKAIGRYFEVFLNTHYGLNAQKKTEYPEDTEATERIIQEARTCGTYEQ